MLPFLKLKNYYNLAFYESNSTREKVFFEAFKGLQKGGKNAAYVSDFFLLITLIILE